MSENQAGQEQGTTGQPEVILNDKGAHVAYSNFARVTAHPGRSDC